MKCSANILLTADNSGTLKLCPRRMRTLSLILFFCKLSGFHSNGSGLKPEGVAILAVLPVEFSTFEFSTFEFSIFEFSIRHVKKQINSVLANLRYVAPVLVFSSSGEASFGFHFILSAAGLHYVCDASRSACLVLSVPVFLFIPLREKARTWGSEVTYPCKLQ